MHYFVAGCGIWGTVLAERIASVLGEKVTVFEKRAHVGGNCYSFIDEKTGIECHAYGSHIFHTSSQQVWEYLQAFTRFNNYKHKVLTTHAGRVYAMPINLFTINALYGKNLTPEEAKNFIAEEIARDSVEKPANLEEKAISLIGRPLYDAFIRDYTKKQWHCDPKDLPPEIITRLPVRINYNIDYFSNPWQGIPLEGYGTMFKKILQHPNITIETSCDYMDVRDKLPSDAMVFYSGLPDRLFDYEYGELEWRSLDFQWECHDVQDYQGTSVMNYADADVPYTRIHEFKHYHPERQTVFESGQTVICREYPAQFRQGAEAYYPINNERNNTLHARYMAKAQKNPNLIIGGRLGAYKYWDMDKAITNALETFETIRNKQATALN